MRTCPLVMTLAAGTLVAATLPAQTILQLNSRGAYLRANSDATVNPLAVTIASLGAAPGDTIRIEVLGTFQMTSNPASQSFSAAGVFSSTNQILAASVQFRVPGAIDAGRPYITPATFFGGLPTDIPQDFLISLGVQGEAVVTIPPGSVYLFLGPVDSYYSDNSDPDGDYRVRISRICGLSDVAGANQSTIPDNQLTADDIIVFLNWFFNNAPRADVAGSNQSTSPDGLFTADDIIVFLGRYFAGC